MQALQALRGVQLVAAMTLVAELQDFVRFEHPRKLMAYVGLAPGEHSSGPKRRQGSIPKAGNSAARRMLVEVAWHYQHSPRVSPIIATRQDGLPKEVTDIAWKAQLRLNAKFKRLLAWRVMKTKAVVAVARELTGFVWAIGREAQGRAGRASRPTHRATPRLERAEDKYADQGGEDRRCADPVTDSDAAGGTRRSRGHWGTLENVIGGPGVRQRTSRDLSA